MTYLMRGQNVGIALLISFAAISACVGPISPSVTGLHQSSLSQGLPTPITRTETADRSETPGMRIYLDPQTGEVTAPPPSVAAQSQKQALQAIKPTVTELRETVSPVPGGGFMIDLKDQFMSPLAATVDGNGKVSVKHQSEASE
jgi:hypothetical protein